MPDALGRLRSIALIVMLIGAVGSVAFLHHAGRNSPQRLLMVIMAGWVLAPYAALLVADVMSMRWSTLTRQALYIVMLVVTLGALAVYWNDMVRPRKAQPAAMYVLVPVVSWLVIFAVVPIAALVSRKRT